MERALVILTPSEAKRLIGKAVSIMEPVRTALKGGMVIICLGTTNSYVFEEITRKRLEERGRFSKGVLTADTACVSKAETRMAETVIKNGYLTDLGLKDALKDLGPEDVFIKGANAVDPRGNAGIYLGSSTGGTIGMSIGVLMARGVKIVVPVSLEKLVPYAITDIAPKLGNLRYAASMGMPFGMMPIAGEVITEVVAVKMLFGCECLPVGGGGINGGEGCRCYLIEGEEDSLKRAWSLLSEIKGELPVKTELEDCGECRIKCRKGWKDAT